MGHRTIVAAAVACSIAAVIGDASRSPAGAQLVTIAPIVIREAKDHPGCQVYLKADGSRLLYKGAAVTPGGKCPEQFKRGKVTRFGSTTYKMEIDGKTCVMNPQGLGRCE